MKRIIIRIFLVLIAIGIGVGIFFILTFAGNKSYGPLTDVFRGIEYNVATMEQRIIGSSREKRSVSLTWFDQYRNDSSLILNPDRILLGAYDDRTVETYEPIIVLEDSLHTRLPIIHFYTAWGSKPTQVFPFLRAQAIWDLGSMPLITWEPWLDDFDTDEFNILSGREEPNKGGLRLIHLGFFDSYIDQWASAARDFGHPIFIRFAHEMNDPYRYPWGPQNNKPSDFIQAWQHVVERFRLAGADNVIWIWSPHPAYTDFDYYYPGQDYVDWVGVTTLNYGAVATWSRWWSFDEIFQKCYTEIEDYDKPIMLTEFSSLAVGGDRAQWFADALNSLPEEYPNVKSVVFFHVSSDNTTSYKTLDWSFRSDSVVVEEIRGAFRAWDQVP